jgi:putative sterol carrier protein
LKYLSLDYWKEVQKIAATDNEFGIKAKMFVASFTFKVVDKADLPIIYAKFNGGKMEDGIWSQVNKNELAADNAIMSRQLQFKGNMNTIMRYSKAFLRLFQLMQKIPVDY